MKNEDLITIILMVKTNLTVINATLSRIEDRLDIIESQTIREEQI